MERKMIDIIEKAWEEFIQEEERNEPREPHPYIYASARRKCLRRMVLECKESEVFHQYNVETKAKFIRGNQREKDLRRSLSRVGQLSKPPFEFIGEQKKVQIFHHSRLLISGKIDGLIVWNHGADVAWPTEIKSWDRNLTNKINSFEDLYQSPWTWAAAHQILAYLYMESQPTGLLVLDRPGLPKLIEVSLEKNLDSMEGFLKDAEQTISHLDNGTLPDYIDDREECHRCPAFNTICEPPSMDQGKGLRVFNDPNLEALLEEMALLEPAGKRYNYILEDMKKTFRGVENGVCGPWSLQGKWSKQTSYNVPVEIKEQYKDIDDHGKFTLKITKI
jgi:hypothetical protein